MWVIAVLVVIGWLGAERAFAERIVAWGMNQDGQCNVPEGRDYVAISARFTHNLALRADGSIVGWGQNNHGQSDAPAGKDFTMVAAGLVHSLALKADGSLMAWGRNDYGQCDVPQGNDFVAIAAGDSHNLALKSDGSIIAWGDNDYGQRNAPDGNDFVAIAAGGSFSVALRADGSLAVWGRLCGSIGPLRLPCLSIIPAGYSYIAIAAGGNSLSSHGLALRIDGSIAAWGSNDQKQCDVPTGSGFTAIAAGESHSLALKSDGSLVAWGRNDCGQCDVPAGNNFLAVSAGSRHCIALLTEPKIGHPTADAGKDHSARANEEVTLDGSKSSDADGQIVLYTWTRLPDDVIIYSGPEPRCKTRALGRAEEVFELTVTDNDMLTASDTVIIFNQLLKDLEDRLAGM